MPKQLVKLMLACALTAGGGYQVAYAQQNAGATAPAGACTGTVLDSTGEPVIGASVFVKGTSKGVATNIDGQFTLTGVKSGAVIHVSSVGCKPVDVT